jgi:hypothetical protein
MKKRSIKKRLKELLRDIGVKQEDLYYKTGYEFADVKTEEDLKEIIRLLNIFYYINTWKYEN